MDATILAKALAHHLENILPSTVSDVQSRFIKEWDPFYNVCTLLWEWDYILTILSKFGLGNTYISSICLLCTSPQAISRLGMECNLSLYTDDLLLNVSDPFFAL